MKKSRAGSDSKKAANDDVSDKDVKNDNDTGADADMYHFTSRWDMYLFVGFILAVLILLLLVLLFNGSAEAMPLLSEFELWSEGAF